MKTGSAKTMTALSQSVPYWQFLTVVFTILLTLCIQPGAFALELHIYNDFDKEMSVAVVYFDAQNQKWRTQGWFVTNPKSERIVDLRASKMDIYIYSQLADASMPRGTGDITKTVIGDDFSFYDGEECPQGRERRNVRFTKYLAKNNFFKFRPGLSEPAKSPLRTGDTDAQKSASYANVLSNQSTALLKLFNEERRKIGVPALMLNENMNKAANRRASEMSQKFSHERPDGRGYDTVFKEFNLAPRIYSESMSWKSGSKEYTSIENFHNGFMDNPTSREKILSPEFSTIGIGFAVLEEKHYVVILYAGRI
jgi:uncharacterized protein YkwD/uncharacterized membrane protein